MPCASPQIIKAVGAWLFDEGEGLDVRGGTAHENHGTLKSEAAWVDGKFGTAVEFDGEEDYIDVPDSPVLNITEAITVVIWAK